MNSFRRKIIYFSVTVLILAAVFGAGYKFGEQSVVCKVCKPENIDFSLFWDAYQKLQQNFIDLSKISVQKIIYGAIEGMTRSLGDPYTGFLNPEQAKRFQQDLSGSFEGIGVEIGIKKDRLTVVAPLPDTPGERAGLKSGDLILKIDDKDASQMTTDEAVSLIRGAKGTNVTLTIFREGWNKQKDIAITRGTIKIPSMKWSLKDDDVAYVKIFQFDENLFADFKLAALEILQSPAKRIIIDLRNNPGGYLELSQYVAGWFLQEGQTVVIEDFGENREKQIYKAEGNAGLANYPTVILINEGSASASEILAGALRDNRKIKLIGKKSFGKGSVQEVVNLRGGSFLKITIAKWLTPNGASISEVGLEPDIKVEVTDQDLEQKNDPQLNKALEIVKGLK